MEDIPSWIVTDVEPHADYTLLLFFANGETRVFNARPLLEKPRYQKLKSLTYFLKAAPEHGTVAWNHELDIAPEHLYQYSVPKSLI